MPVTIQLDDDLAGQLQSKAVAHQLSLEEFTARLLGGALGEMAAAEACQDQNRRRVSLIRKSSTNGLSPQEQAELQELQTALDQRLEPVDEQLLDRLQHLQHATAELSGNDKR
jgi:hypothetical protein